jgi:hypothetical protein
VLGFTLTLGQVRVATYYVPQNTLNFELLVVAPFDKLKLESQVSLFKTTMIHNAFEKLEEKWQIMQPFEVQSVAYIKL